MLKPREILDRKIDDLKTSVVDLGNMVKKATIDAVEALKDRDLKASRIVYVNDKLINEKRFEIENDCLVVIATQQPLAKDLRILASILEIITELERMGDYAKGIARISMMIGKKKLLKPLDDFPHMAEIATDMLVRAVKAFVEEDVESARIIPEDDDLVDDLFNKIYHDLVDRMMKKTKTIDRANHLQWAAHNIERLADRVTNICERTIFVATGETHELEESDENEQFI
jgi:phosphate transport system protein